MEDSVYMKKQPEITAQTKQNLTDAFWTLYCKCKTEKISVKDVTTKAGYNRSTFYKYFTDVYDVLEQIESFLIDDIAAADIISKEAFIPLSYFIEQYQKHRNYYVVLLGENGDPSFQSKIKNRYKQVLKQKSSSLGINDDYYLDYALEYVLSAMIGILNYCFKQENSPPIKNIIELIYDITQNGIKDRLPFFYLI